NTQPIPLLPVDRRLGDEHGRLQPIVRELDGLQVVRLGLGIQVDGEVAGGIGGLREQYFAAPARPIDQPEVQATRVHSLSEHETLGLSEIKNERELSGHVSVDTHRGHDSFAAGYRGQLSRYLRAESDPAVRERLKLNPNLCSLARGQVRDVP